MLRFASKCEALQHLADLTGKQVRVAVGEEAKKRLARAIIKQVPELSRDWTYAEYDDPLEDYVLRIDVTDQVKKVLANAADDNRVKKQYVKNFDHFWEKPGFFAYIELALQFDEDAQEFGVLMHVTTTEVSLAIEHDSFRVKDPNMPKRLGKFVSDTRNKFEKMLVNIDLWN